MCPSYHRLILLRDPETQRSKEVPHNPRTEFQKGQLPLDRDSPCEEDRQFPKQGVTLSTSLVRSKGSVIWKVILVPKGSTAPPDFTCTDNSSQEQAAERIQILTHVREPSEDWLTPPIMPPTSYQGQSLLNQQWQQSPKPETPRAGQEPVKLPTNSAFASFKKLTLEAETDFQILPTCGCTL